MIEVCFDIVLILIIFEFWEENILFDIVEYDMDFVKQIADKVTVLHEGKILMEGGVKEVLADPTVQKVYLGRGGE